jgi:hypothetical protein
MLKEFETIARREGLQSISLLVWDMSGPALFPKEGGESSANPAIRTPILNTLLTGHPTCKKVEGFEYSDKTMNELLEASKLFLEFTVEGYITIQEDINRENPKVWDIKKWLYTKAFLRGQSNKLFHIEFKSLYEGAEMGNNFDRQILVGIVHGLQGQWDRVPGVFRLS